MTAGNAVLAGSLDQRLYALDPSTGAELWRCAAGGWIWSAPVQAEGIGVFGCYDGNLYGVDLDSGRQTWVFPGDAIIHGSPAAGEGLIYFGDLDGKVRAVRIPEASPGP